MTLGDRLETTDRKAEESRLAGSGPPPPPDSGDLVAGTWDFTRTRRWDLALLEY